MKCLQVVRRTAMVLAVLSTTVSAAEFQEDVTYVTRGDRELKLDIGYTPEQSMRPLVLFVHGGGWRAGHRKVYHKVMSELIEEGFVCATVEYRFTDVAAWPAQIDDVLAARDWLVRHADRYGIDVERMAVLGGSAGGHLSLMAGMMPKESSDELRFRLVVNHYGPTDLVEAVKNERVTELIEALAGGSAAEHQDVLKAASPLTYVDRTDPAVVTFHGTEDPLVPIQQARALDAALNKAQVPHHLHILEGVGHNLGPEAEQRWNEVKAALRLYLTGGKLPLLAHEDFRNDLDRWELTDATAWKTLERNGRQLAALTKKRSNYEPKVRSPYNQALLKDVVVGDFVLDVDLHSTNEVYGHQDLCLFFGHQDPEHFYYVHLGRKADPHANSIFLVNGEPRVSIAQKRTDGTDWSRGWHRARIVRDVEQGTIKVYFDDMQQPVMEATDKHFTSGRVGIGSFDDIGEYDAVRLYARPAR